MKRWWALAFLAIPRDLDPVYPLVWDGGQEVLAKRPGEEVLASFYVKGRLTASGERFNTWAFTAAHKTLPFGTIVRVTDPLTGRSCLVRINDRGPYIWGREIDLSKAAARKLGMLRDGVIVVTLEVL
jgi:rare lipoprotein A